MQRAAFLLECLANGVILKGQMLVDEPLRMIIFVGSPVINDRTKLKEYGLTLSDFPMHDSTADLVVFQQQRLINRKLENLVQERTIQLEAEQAKSDSLLHEMLPAGIVKRLKSGEGLIADRFTSVSVLFADLVGFTPLTAELAPAEIVELLMELFSHFDSLIGKYGVEKIRTIGDNYMVVAPPTSRPCPGPGAHGPGNVCLHPKPAALPKPPGGFPDGSQLGSGHRGRDRPPEIPV